MDNKRIKTIPELQARCDEIQRELRESKRVVRIGSGGGYEVWYDSRKDMVCEICGRTMFIAHTQENKILSICQEGGIWQPHFPLCKPKPKQMDLDQAQVEVGKKVVADQLLEKMKKAEGLIADPRYDKHPQRARWIEQYQGWVDQWEVMTGLQYIKE